MPPKVRELIRELKKVGFREQPGKGSHRKFKHPKGVNLTLSGGLGSDARKYQIQDVKQALRLVANEKK